MQFWSNWLTIFIVGCLAVTSPGANFFVTLRNSLAYSKQAGVFTALGLAVGDLVHAAYCLAGIGAIISKSILLFTLIKWLGAIYLIYIGIKSLKARKRQRDDMEKQSSQTMTPWGAFCSGFLTCALNPKVTLFFLALFTQVIHPNTPFTTQAIYSLTIVDIEFFWFALVATVVSQDTVRYRFLSISHWFDRAMGTVLIFLGFRLALTRAVE
jgi:RhtB (resistance to homoserine/threonine) family protein